MNNLYVERVLDPRNPESQMEDIENVELGRKLIETLRASDSPLVVQLVVDKYRGIESPPLYHIRTSLKITKVKSMDVTLHREPYLVAETPKSGMSTVLAGAIILLWAFVAAGLFHWVYSVIIGQ